MSLFNKIDEEFDEVIGGNALEVAKALGDPTGDFLTWLAGAALAGWAAIAMFRGTFSVEGFLTFVFRYAVFYSLVVGGVALTKYVYPFIIQGPVEVGNVIIDKFTGSSGSSGGVLTALGRFVTESFNNITEAASEVSINVIDVITNNAENELATWFLAILSMAAVVLMAIIATGFAVIAKLLTAVLISITPVLAVWAYLKSTSDVFNGWIRGITMLMLWQILIYGILGIILAVNTKVAADVAGAADGEVLGEIFLSTVLSGIGVVGIGLTPIIANRIGGAAIALGGAAITGSMLKLGSMGADKLGSLIRKGVGDGMNDANRARDQAQAAAQTQAAAPPNHSRAEAAARRVSNM